MSEEPFTLDQKRNERKGLNNDLWDAIEKFRARGNQDFDKLAYYQPKYYPERWRLVDQHALETFAEVEEVARWKDGFAAIHELFPELPRSPTEAEEAVAKRESSKLEDYIEAAFHDSATAIKEELKNTGSEGNEAKEMAQKGLKKAASQLGGCAINRELISIKRTL